MDGLTAAGELTRIPPRAARRVRSGRAFIVDLVESRRIPSCEPDDASAREDDESIRRLLRESVFGREIGVSLAREPDSSAAAGIEGDVHDTLVARDAATGRVVATAARSVRDAYLNGVSARLGCLGQLRIDPRFRQRRILDAGFEMCRALHERGDARVYLLSVVADHAPARRMLERQRPGWPAIEPIERFVTLAVPVGGVRRPVSERLELLQGSAVGAAAIAECLARNQRRYQFAPRWTVADLESPRRTRGLTLDDFILALRHDAVAGCAACWDQRAFRQVVVRRYSARLALCRPLINLVAPLSGIPALPPPGRRLEFAYLSHLAIEGDDPEVFDALLREGLLAARRKQVDYLVLGLPARSPLLQHVQRACRHRAYESMLYVGFWPDGERLARSLDGRPANPEVALL